MIREYDATTRHDARLRLHGVIIAQSQKAEKPSMTSEQAERVIELLKQILRELSDLHTEVSKSL
jgi:hypothetical protein